jgi:hypothetical protein
VFSPQLIERWISYKRDREITPLRMRPHPLEFSLYYDIKAAADEHVRALSQGKSVFVRGLY